MKEARTVLNEYLGEEDFKKRDCWFRDLDQKLNWSLRNSRVSVA